MVIGDLDERTLRESAVTMRDEPLALGDVSKDARSRACAGAGR